MDATAAEQKTQPLTSEGSSRGRTLGKVGLIVGLLLLLAVGVLMTPLNDLEVHNILHHLNFLPLMLAGLFFGWRGALWALLFAAAVDAPLIAQHWQNFHLDAQDQIVEISIFGAAGVIAGLLADREREQRLRAESNARERDELYGELRANVEKMKKTERLSAAGQLAASLAHEIRNPLASISGAAGILQRGQAAAEDRAECLEILSLESQRLNKLLTNFLDFARPRLPRLQRVSLGEILDSVLALARHPAQGAGVALLREPMPELPSLECDSEQIKQVLLNLIINALQASTGSQGAAVRLLASVGRHSVLVEVVDQGCGFSAEDEARIFDPFFTTKANGTGLGLAIASSIVAQHGGALRWRRNVGRGMTFSMELPLRAPDLRASASSTVGRTFAGELREERNTP